MTTENMQVITPRRSTRKRTQIVELQHKSDNDSDHSEDYKPNRKGRQSSDSQEDSATSEEEAEEEEEYTRLRTPRRQTRSLLATPTKSRQPVTPRGRGRGRGAHTPTPRSMRVKAKVISNALPTRATPRRPQRDIYEEARERLHTATIPSSLPGRETEAIEIEATLEMAISEKTGCCLYISGVPGTGKTATVHECIKRLQEKVDQQELQPFKFVEINGMKITDPGQAYSMLWEALEGIRVTPKHAADLLEKRFSSKRSNDELPCVVLMDELDWLVTKRQTVMYNFFDWPNRANSQFIVIAVANTMDLPERALSNKVSSRLGLSRINFQPYTHEQLCDIVSSRLAGCKAFDPDAIELCGRKVSAVSGDARRALDICRLAVEIMERDYGAGGTTTAATATPSAHSNQAHESAQVTVGVISRAIREMYASGPVAFVRNASLHQKLFLACVVLHLRKSGQNEVSLAEIIPAHQQICRLRQFDTPTDSDLALVCASLGASRCLLVESTRLDLHQRLRLNIGVEDIAMALKSDTLFEQLL